MSCGSGCAVFKKDCVDLVRRIALLKHLLEEIRDSGPLDVLPSESSSSTTSLFWWNDLVVALQAAKRLVAVACCCGSGDSSVSIFYLFLFYLLDDEILNLFRSFNSTMCYLGIIYMIMH